MLHTNNYRIIQAKKTKHNDIKAWFNPLKRSGIRWLDFKVFSTIQV